MASALLLAVLLSTAPADEAEPPPPKPNNIVLADLGLHVIGVGYQRSVTHQVAFQLAVSLYTPWTQNINFLGAAGNADLGDVAGYVARLRMFVYPDAHAPTGFWMSPFVQAGIATETRDGEKQQGLVWAAGATTGWAWLIFNHVHVALGVGVQYHASKFPRGPGFSRFYPTFDANLGWAF